MADIKSLLKKRSTYKCKLTIFSNYLNLLNTGSKISELQRLDLEERFSRFNVMYTEFDALQSEIEMLEEDPEDLLEEREDFERQYFSQVALARSLLGVSSKALVNVLNTSGEKYTARLLLDNGSTANFVTQRLCDKLGLSRCGTRTKVTDQDEMVGIHRRGQAWTAGAHQGEDPATALVTRAGREDLSRRGWHHQGGRIEDKEGDHTSSLQLHLPASTSLKKMTLQPGEYVGASRVLGLLRHRSAIIVSARGAGTLRTCPTPTQPHDRHRCQTRPSHVGAN
ncbi:uncharacterized protein LOC135072630 isoform X4 [Ostrinia nubilalis]|uniref:uncharacterized protein LOC135072630 isoform X4 n=1 Tax=Ostrinia nubilalis TaxID=29057 RepID=UPI00308260AA